jgi:hypothetical protein
VQVNVATHDELVAVLGKKELADCIIQRRPYVTMSDVRQALVNDGHLEDRTAADATADEEDLKSCLVVRNPAIHTAKTAAAAAAGAAL